MSQQKHDIDPWFMPDDEKVLANEAETEHAEEHGELPDEPLCPYCGVPYRDGTDGVYVHALVRKQTPGSKKSSVWQPGIICVSENDKRYLNGFGNAASEDIR
jgi:hypothetical protein